MERGSHSGYWRHRAVTLSTAGLLACAALPPALAQAQTPATQTPATPTSATIAPSLSPDRLGARAALTFTIRYAGGADDVPSPVRRSVVRFPAGLTLDIPHLRSCHAAWLLSRGPGGCPAQSAIGRGHARSEVRSGAQTITEDVALWAFVGPPQDGKPTLELYGQGYAPVQDQVVVTGTVLSGRAPYGEELVIPVPPIPTLPTEPDASTSSFSLTIGASARHRTSDANTVLVPSRCPAGGFPFAAEFTYADGSTGSALATAPCPPKTRVRRSRVGRHAAAKTRASDRAKAGRRAAAARGSNARTISLRETGRLHATYKHEFTLYEQGSASGTFTGTLSVRMTLVSTSRATAQIKIVRSGGSISGYATATYRRSRGTASFSGTLTVTGGSGSYTHVHGSGLSFSGTIAQSNDAIAVQMSGTLSD
jgi:hypothetical protein